MNLARKNVTQSLRKSDILSVISDPRLSQNNNLFEFMLKDKTLSISQMTKGHISVPKLI